jgi:ATP-binding cassette subfamily F protein uup
VWNEYIGGFTDWERYANSVKEQSKLASKLTGKPTTKVAQKSELKSKKLSYKEQRELEELPKQIAQLEAEQQTISALLQDENLYKTQAEKIKNLNHRYAEIDELLLAKLDQWETIEALRK